MDIKAKNIPSLTWRALKKQLQTHPSRYLQFKYGVAEFVNPNYHITEIKQAVITSVDCGGKRNEWTEIIIQLWEPLTTSDGNAMKAEKAVAIIDLVERALILDDTAPVKIEFGNSKFDTRQMLPNGFFIDGEDLIVELQADKTQCKATARGANCGPESVLEVCSSDTGCC